MEAAALIVERPIARVDVDNITIGGPVRTVVVLGAGARSERLQFKFEEFHPDHVAFATLAAMAAIVT